MKRHYLGTITKEIQKKGYFGGGKCECCGVRRPRYFLNNVLGRSLPIDVGKQAYLIDEIMQVENDEQMIQRLQFGQK